MPEILVVDDNDKNLRFLNDVLESQGYTVTTLSSGEETLERAAELTPDLILMDVQMPVLSGTETMQHLKKIDKYKSVPIIAVTALAMKGDDEALLAEGFDGYISKPFSFKLVLQTIKERLEQPETPSTLR